MKFDKSDIFLRNYILISIVVLIPLGFFAYNAIQYGGTLRPYLFPYMLLVVIVVIIGVLSYIAYKLKLRRK